MRVLQLVQKPQRRGAEIFALQLADWLRKAGHEVRTVYLYGHSGRLTLPLHPGDQVLPGNEAHPLERGLGWNPMLLRRLRAAITAYRPEIVQMNGARTVKYGALASLGLARGWSLVYRNISDPVAWLRGWRRKFFYRRLIGPRFDAIVAVSQGALEYLRGFYRAAKPMVYIPTGIDPASLIPRLGRLELRASLGIAPGAPVALFVGSLSPEKNVERLLRVLSRTNESLPGLVLLVVGEGPDSARLQSQARALQLGERARFLGVQEDVASFLGAADLLALPSDTEGIPGVVLEAGYCGLPVVATEVGGMAECVLHGRTGLLLKPYDEAGFSDAVLRLAGSPAERSALGAAGARWVREGFTMDRVAPRYLDLYQQLRRRGA